ncbi:MAG: hypothetical protein AB7K09_12460 [Planctomycetota bacterium]
MDRNAAFQSCIANIKAPNVERETLDHTGRYYRNLQDDEVRVENTTLFVKNPHWNSEHNRANRRTSAGTTSQAALSVNHIECCWNCPLVSLVIAKHQGTKYVAVIDLTLLNRFLAFDRGWGETHGMPVVAVYNPDGENVCHYELRCTASDAHASEFIRDALEQISTWPPTTVRHPDWSWVPTIVSVVEVESDAGWPWVNASETAAE